ncbi:MAG: hypothetical protein U1A77_20800 [Pirellulales bacterium]
MKRIAVIHLVRQASGLSAFRAFLDSYRRHPAGVAHQLVLLRKGFTSEEEFAEYSRLIEGVPHQRLDVPDQGFAFGSYRMALDRTEFDEYCFLHSYSVILAPDWLAKLHACLSQPNVGLVGATGSYESTYENLRAEIRSIRGVFRRRRLRALLRLGLMWWDYPAFPNPTLRTNAFLGRRDLLRALFPMRDETKEVSLRFESGRNGLTRQVQRRGLRTLVVDHSGRGFEPEEWPESRTFRLQDQANLLVADNQTERYAHAGDDERRWLSQLAWGRDCSRV